MKKQITTVLFAGGTKKDYQEVKQLLAQYTRHRHIIEWESDMDYVVKVNEEMAFDIILVFEKVGQKNGLEFLQWAVREEFKTPMILISRGWDDDLEDAALLAGAFNYMAIEYLNPHLFAHSIHYAIQLGETRHMLAHERDLLRTLMENIPDTIYFKNLKSEFTRINMAQARILGLNHPDEAIGKTDFDFFDHAQEAFADEQQIIETGTPLINKQEKIRRADGEYRHVSATKVPIYNRVSEIVGTVGITRDISDRVKAEQELSQVKEELEKALFRVQEELDVARQIQKSLLPAKFPDVGGFEAAAAYIPCSEIGGDLYDVVPIDENRIGFLMFDVVGHGVPAALIAAMGKMIFLKNINDGLSPRELLVQVNDDLAYHLSGKRYLAAFYGILNKKTYEFIFSKAAHPPAYLIRRGQRKIETLSTAGTFVGLFPHEEFEEKSVLLNPGDKLIIFTDGLIETFSPGGDFFGLKRLGHILQKIKNKSVHDIISDLLRKQQEFAQTAQHNDDISILAIEIT